MKTQFCYAAHEGSSQRERRGEKGKGGKTEVDSCWSSYFIETDKITNSINHTHLGRGGVKFSWRGDRVSPRVGGAATRRLVKDGRLPSVRFLVLFARRKFWAFIELRPLESWVFNEENFQICRFYCRICPLWLFENKLKETVGVTCMLQQIPLLIARGKKSPSDKCTAQCRSPRGKYSIEVSSMDEFKSY